MGFLNIIIFLQNHSSVVSQFRIYTIIPYINIILPVGISFYTFHGLSYVIDVYKGRIKAERNFIDYSVFVSFFPLLVAGPIERATHLLPQIKKKRVFNYAQAVDGLRQILWGLFKKMVIADLCAVYANTFFNDSANYSGSTLFIGCCTFYFSNLWGLFWIFRYCIRDRKAFWILTYYETLHFHIFQGILLNSGDDGICHYQHGLEITYIFHLEEVRVIPG